MFTFPFLNYPLGERASLCIYFNITKTRIQQFPENKFTVFQLQEINIHINQIISYNVISAILFPVIVLALSRRHLSANLT